MRIALYARVSRGRQQHHQTIEQQLERLEAEVSKHPDWELAEENVYRDDCHSGAKRNRPGLERLRDHAGMAAFELVLVTAPERWARKYVHQVLLIEELSNLGCSVKLLERPMKADDPHDQLLLQIRGAVAEYERNLIAERRRRGRQAKLRAGTLLPWTVAPYGYGLDPERPRDPSRVRLDPVKAEVVRQIFAWYSDPDLPATLYWVAKKLSDLGIPTPRGGDGPLPASVACCVRQLMRAWRLAVEHNQHPLKLATLLDTPWVLVRVPVGQHPKNGSVSRFPLSSTKRLSTRLKDA